jgi:hypothetical protein
MIADFWDAIEQAERTRGLGILGLYELTKTLERKEQELGVSREDPELPESVKGTPQAHWERAESASIEIGHGSPHLNAQALVSMNSALDALVDEYVPAMRAIRVKMLAANLLERAEQQEPEAAKQLTDEQGEPLVGAIERLIATDLPRLARLAVSGIERYEGRLRQEGSRRLPIDRSLRTSIRRSPSSALSATCSRTGQAAWTRRRLSRRRRCATRTASSYASATRSTARTRRPCAATPTSSLSARYAAGSR